MSSDLQKITSFTFNKFELFLSKIFLVTILMNISLAFASETIPSLRVGDIIFHKSMSSQSNALKEITQSEWTHVGILVQDKNLNWYVAEAAATVRATPIQDFINRGENKEFVIKRLRKKQTKRIDSFELNLLNALKKYRNKNYDIYFRWEDELIYCSELVWKVYKDAFNIELTKMERFSDLYLDGPEATKLRVERYERRNIPFNLNEKVVTPVLMFNSPLLREVHSSKKEPSFIRPLKSLFENINK